MGFGHLLLFCFCLAFRACHLVLEHLISNWINVLPSLLFCMVIFSANSWPISLIFFLVYRFVLNFCLPLLSLRSMSHLLLFFHPSFSVRALGSSCGVCSTVLVFPVPVNKVTWDILCRSGGIFFFWVTVPTYTVKCLFVFENVPEKFFNIVHVIVSFVDTYFVLCARNCILGRISGSLITCRCFRFFRPVILSSFQLFRFQLKDRQFSFALSLRGWKAVNTYCVAESVSSAVTIFDCTSTIMCGPVFFSNN